MLLEAQPRVALPAQALRQALEVLLARALPWRQALLQAVEALPALALPAWALPQALEALTARALLDLQSDESWLVLLAPSDVGHSPQL